MSKDGEKEKTGNKKPRTPSMGYRSLDLSMVYLFLVFLHFFNLQIVHPGSWFLIVFTVIIASFIP